MLQKYFFLFYNFHIQMNKTEFLIQNSILISVLMLSGKT